MILANTTSIGMQPKVDETPISKVCYLYGCSKPINQLGPCAIIVSGIFEFAMLMSITSTLIFLVKIGFLFK